MYAGYIKPSITNKTLVFYKDKLRIIPNTIINIETMKVLLGNDGLVHIYLVIFLWLLFSHLEKAISYLVSCNHTIRFNPTILRSLIFLIHPFTK